MEESTRMCLGKGGHVGVLLFTRLKSQLVCSGRKGKPTGHPSEETTPTYTYICIYIYIHIHMYIYI